jgi:thiamine pyrophosphate-dependent acetolactate synthase large subunit-like protein
MGKRFFYQWRYYDVDRPDTDFAKIANSFGARGVTIRKLKNWKKNLDIVPLIRDSMYWM